MRNYIYIGTIPMNLLILKKNKSTFIEYLTSILFHLFNFKGYYEESSTIHRKSSLWCVYTFG